MVGAAYKVGQGIFIWDLKGGYLNELISTLPEKDPLVAILSPHTQQFMDLNKEEKQEVIHNE